jgi:PAS domain S-box-containing protein
MESTRADTGTPYEAIVEQAPDAVIFADPDGLIRVWNRGAEAIFGYAAPEVLGTSLDIIIPEPLRKAHWAGFRKALESGTTKYSGRVLTTRSMHKDGRRLYVDLSFSLVRDAAGAIIGALAMARDCTERYLAEKARAAKSASGEGATRST